MYKSIAELKRNVKVWDKFTRTYSAVWLPLEEMEVVNVYWNHLQLKNLDRSKWTNLYYNDKIMGHLKIEWDVLNVYDKKTEKLISSFII